MSILAGYRDDQLHIISCERLPRNLSKLKELLIPKIKSFQEKGFIVLVDEVLPVFSNYARAVKLSDIDSSGTPIMVSSLQAYKNMAMLQAITFPICDSGAFDIPDSIVEEQRDSSGRVNYRINWTDLRPESTLLLLSIHAATQSCLYDAPATNQLLSELGISHYISEPSHNSSSAFQAITRGYDARFLSVDGLDIDDE